MGLAKLRRNCRALLRDLEPSCPFDLDSFCRTVAARRGRPILLHPLPAGVTGIPCGVWLATVEADHVFHVRGASPMHRQHIILHELGHMLHDHEFPLVSEAMSALLVPDVDPRTVRRMLARSGYTAPQEREAEVFASVVVEYAASRSAWPDDALGRVGDALAGAPPGPPRG